MTTTVSPKYQIVIPKAVRQQLAIKPGQKMEVEAGKNGTIIITQTADSPDAIQARLDALWKQTSYVKVGRKLSHEEMNER